MTPFTRLTLIGAAAVSSLLCGAAAAGDAKNAAYLVDRTGTPIMTRNGDCIRTRQWTADQANPNCKFDAPAKAQRAAPAKPARR